jgi:hypothetical protein
MTLCRSTLAAATRRASAALAGSLVRHVARSLNHQRTARNRVTVTLPRDAAPVT